MRRKSLWPSFRKEDKDKTSDDAVDETLDDALKALAAATKRNAEVVEKVRRRQSSGQIKVVAPE